LKESQVAANALSLKQASLETKLTHMRNKLESEIETGNQSVQGEKKEADASQKQSEALFAAVAKDIQALDSTAAHASAESENARQLNVASHAAKSNATSAEQTAEAVSSQAASAQSKSDTIAAELDHERSKVKVLSGKLAPAQEAEQLVVQLKLSIVSLANKHSQAHKALLAAQKTLASKTSQKKFAQKVGRDHLTGQAQKKLLKAASDAEKKAKSDLKGIQARAQQAAHAKAKAGKALNAASHKSAKLKMDSSSEAIEFEEEKSRLDAMQTTLDAAQARASGLGAKATIAVAAAKAARESISVSVMATSDSDQDAATSQANAAILESKVVLEKKQLTQAVNKASTQLATSAAMAEKVKGREDALQQANEILTVVAAAAPAPAPKVTKKDAEAAKAGAAEAKKEAKEANQALEQALKSDSAKGQADKLKAERKTAEGAKSGLKGADKAKAQEKISSLKKAEKDAAKKAESASKKAADLAKHGEANIEATKVELKQVQKKIKLTKEKYDSAKKAEDLASKKADESENDATKKKAETAKAKADLDQTTKDDKDMEKAVKPSSL